MYRNITPIIGLKQLKIWLEFIVGALVLAQTTKIQNFQKRLIGRSGFGAQTRPIYEPTYFLIDQFLVLNHFFGPFTNEISLLQMIWHFIYMLHRS